MKNALLALAILAALLAAAALPALGAARPAATTWEYFHTGLPAGDVAKPLNRLGADGWELVTVYEFNSAPQALFKRPK